MTVGLSTTNTANKLLATLTGGTAFSNSATWVELHTADPGSAGTTAVSAVTTRQQATFATPSAGAVALLSSPTAWSMTSTETISHIAVWSASTSGNFLWSAALSVSKSVANGDTLTLTTCGLSLAPLAA